METYRSNGKLLLTGEYTVLDGALSLALPTKLGQTLVVEKNNSSQLTWKSIDEKGNIWFEDCFNIDAILSKKDIPLSNNTSKRLLEILRAVNSLKPGFFNPKEGLSITTTLEFNRHWGLGTSSTLINNMSSWAKIDAYQLLKDTFGGSGYDIACAQYNGPVLYQIQKNNNPLVRAIPFNPPFSHYLYFVYLNLKQNSREGISSYRNLNKVNSTVIDRVSAITTDITKCKSLDQFNRLIIEHETIISELIQQEPIKQRLFNDFDGEVKSLGAWGGDFILATSKNNPSDYFKSKGLDIVIPFSKMVLG